MVLRYFRTILDGRDNDEHSAVEKIKSSPEFETLREIQAAQPTIIFKIDYCSLHLFFF